MEFDQLNKRFAQLGAFDNHVDLSMTEQILCRLEIGRELLANRLLDHAPSSKADLQEERKNQGKLSDSDQVTLDWTYIKLSRREAKAKRYKQAVLLLETVSDTMKEDEDVQSALKRYRKLAK